jgi:hypothetical protein
MSDAPLPVPPAETRAPALPRRTWILLGLAAALAIGAFTASRYSPNPTAIGVAVACAAVGSLPAWRAHRLALRSHARAAMISAALLLGFLATGVAIAFALGLLAVITTRL